MPSQNTLVNKIKPDADLFLDLFKQPGTLHFEFCTVFTRIIQTTGLRHSVDRADAAK